jgi:hypothetical protein
VLKERFNEIVSGQDYIGFDLHIEQWSDQDEDTFKIANDHMLRLIDELLHEMN